MTTAFWIFAGFAFLFGAIVGSFLNVVIYRVPAGLSVVSPPSRCPACETPIAWYDNIPIVSWLVLGGKCRHCSAPISARYALIEGLTGLFSLGLYWKVAARPFEVAITPAQLPVGAIVLPFVLYFTFLCLLIVIAFVDLDHYIIPHVFTLPGIALGAATPWLFDWLLADGALYGFWPPVTPTLSLLGLVFGGLSVLAIYFSYLALRGVAGLGGGDVTLMALVGAWLGWPALVFVFFGSSAQGTLAAAVAHLMGTGWLKTPDEIYGPDEPTPGTLEAEPTTAPPPAHGVEPPADVDRPTDPPATPAPPEPEAGLAGPFGPFIALTAAEHFFLGPYLPRVLSMAYLY